MFKSLATKIFISFAALVLIEATLLALVFSKHETQVTETSILESLSKRVQSKLETLSIDSNGYVIFEEGAQGPDRLPENFSRESLASLLPPSGSSVTPCQNTKSESYFCGFAYSPTAHAWAFDLTPQETLSAATTRRLAEIFPFIFGLLAAAIALSFLLSRFLLGPLQRFAEASDAISKGQYEDIQLPALRNDEIGELAQSFKKMIGDLRERELNLKLSGLKLAHSARLASVGQMGASIAHEVKNPLTSMMGYAKILMNKAEAPEIKEAAEIIFKECERCNQILQQMLRFARNDPAEKRPYSLKEVVHSVLLLLKAEARNRKIELEAEGLTDTIVVGSAQQIQQVLINLIMNALHASSAGSKVSIKMREEVKLVVLQVQDRGRGIPKEMQSKIFDPFFTTKAKDGTGLGLSVAQEILEQQGGGISFESEEGKGSTFEISLTLPGDG
jgi:signal transduction histidine kinase